MGLVLPLARARSWNQPIKILGDIHDLDVFLERADKCARQQMIGTKHARSLRQRLGRQRQRWLTSAQRALQPMKAAEAA